MAITYMTFEEWKGKYPNKARKGEESAKRSYAAMKRGALKEGKVVEAPASPSSSSTASTIPAAVDALASLAGGAPGDDPSEEDDFDYFTQEMLDTDYRLIVDEDRPALPPGYVYRFMRSDDGSDWETKIRPASEPVYVYDKAPGDSSFLPHDVTNHPALRGMSLRWENPPSTKGGTYGDAVQTGYTEVRASQLKGTYLGRHVEADRVYNEDMVLMARPMVVTEARNKLSAAKAREQLAQVYGPRGIPGTSETEPIKGEEFEYEFTHSRQDGQMAPVDLQAQQAEWRRNAAVGKKSFAMPNAPFQARIIGGKTYREESDGSLIPLPA